MDPYKKEKTREWIHPVPEEAPYLTSDQEPEKGLEAQRGHDAYSDETHEEAERPDPDQVDPMMEEPNKTQYEPTGSSVLLFCARFTGLIMENQRKEPNERRIWIWPR
jgi:hypothetical protein